MTLAEFPDLQELSTERKIELIDALCESIRPQIERKKVSEEVERVLDERWQSYLDHRDDVLTLEQLMERVAAQRAQ